MNITVCQNIFYFRNNVFRNNLSYQKINISIRSSNLKFQLNNTRCLYNVVWFGMAHTNETEKHLLISWLSRDKKNTLHNWGYWKLTKMITCTNMFYICFHNANLCINYYFRTEINDTFILVRNNFDEWINRFLLSVLMRKNPKSILKDIKIVILQVKHKQLYSGGEN